MCNLYMASGQIDSKEQDTAGSNEAEIKPKKNNDHMSTNSEEFSMVIVEIIKAQTNEASFLSQPGLLVDNRC